MLTPYVAYSSLHSPLVYFGLKHKSCSLPDTKRLPFFKCLLHSYLFSKAGVCACIHGSAASSRLSHLAFSHWHIQSKGMKIRFPSFMFRWLRLGLQPLQSNLKLAGQFYTPDAMDLSSALIGVYQRGKSFTSPRIWIQDFPNERQMSSLFHQIQFRLIQNQSPRKITVPESENMRLKSSQIKVKHTNPTNYPQVSVSYIHYFF